MLHLRVFRVNILGRKLIPDSRPSVAALLLFGILVFEGFDGVVTMGMRFLTKMAMLLLLGTAAEAKDSAIHAGRLIDGIAGVARSNVTILIHDDRIVSVTDGFTAPQGAEIIDLSHATVLPGLIDCHVHVTSQYDGGNPVAERFTSTRFDDAMKATAYARATLLGGFTSVRDAGADTDVVVALKKAIAAGTVTGPRLWVAGAPVGPTGGHNDDANGIDRKSVV